MKKTILSAMAVALGLGFVGCGKEEKAYSEEYYRNNPEAMKLQLEKCEKAEELSDIEMKNCKTAKWVNTKKKQTQAPFSYDK